jgi:copper homeostasis protein
MDVMRRDARVAHDGGAAGVVVGALAGDSTIDADRTRELIAAAGGLPATFHRAFDLVPDRASALEVLAAIGVERVLTSGGARSAIEGADAIRQLIVQSDGRVAIMAGGGVREDHVGELVRRSGVREVHVRGTTPVRGVWPQTDVRFRKAWSGDEGMREETSASRIAELARLAGAAIDTGG